ncbi:MAG: hypothetical protein C6I00_04825 [Nitratiruptor sp.]|nr:hypothetical protein [Nitratiruptor sp.]NPA84233.1 hypothetical protein [Campylobacterota bacterium]
MKLLIAVAGEAVFGKPLISVVNQELDEGAMAIGINIAPSDFERFISGLPHSKVEATIFMPEYQERAARHFDLAGALLALIRRPGGELEFIRLPEPLPLDDRSLLQTIQQVREIHGA